jgi:hypothetical protein
MEFLIFYYFFSLLYCCGKIHQEFEEDKFYNKASEATWIAIFFCWIIFPIDLGRK